MSNDLSNYSQGITLSGCFSCHGGRLFPADQFEHEAQCPEIAKLKEWEGHWAVVVASIDEKRGTVTYSSSVKK